MSTEDFVYMYVRAYPAVRNEMLMRENLENLNGRFVRDDQVVNGSLHAFAWVLFGSELPVLHFPETYGRKVIVKLYDMWDNIIKVYRKPGDYLVDIPGNAAGVVIGSVECLNRADEQEYQMALDVLQDLSINDVGIGVNDYEDYQTVVRGSSNLSDVAPQDMNAKEYMAIVNAVYKYNPFPDKNNGWAEMLDRSMEMSPVELERIRKLALKELRF